MMEISNEKFTNLIICYCKDHFVDYCERDRHPYFTFYFHKRDIDIFCKFLGDILFYKNNFDVTLTISYGYHPFIHINRYSIFNVEGDHISTFDVIIYNS